MTTSWFGLGLLVGLGMAVAVGCGLASASMQELAAGAGDYGASGGSTAAGGGDAGIDASLGDGGPDTGPLSYSALCGEGCIPSLDADAGGCSQGAGGGGGTSAPEMDGCRLEYDSNSESLQGACGAVGQSPEGSSCFSTSDCAVGLACVGTGSGACRPYCCGDLEACAPGTFCRPEPLVSDPPVAPSDDAVVLVPVCALATQCTLLDDGTCTDGQTCTIVRVDGTTSCVAPGAGQLGDPCSCAAGFVCATGSNQCMQLCRIGQNVDCPESYTCQGGATTYPEGFGVCVSTA
jgi:hypothetical protein